MPIVLVQSVYSGDVPFECSIDGVRDQITLHFDLTDYVVPDTSGFIPKFMGDQPDVSSIEAEYSGDGVTWESIGGGMLADTFVFGRVSGPFIGGFIRGVVHLVSPVSISMLTD